MWLMSGMGMSLLVREFEDPDGIERTLDQGVIDMFADTGNIWAGARVQIPLSLGCWAVGSTLKKEGLAALGYDLSRSLLISTGIVVAVKYSVHRTRPNGEDLSFPSGHTASAFSFAGVVCGRYGFGWGGAGVALGVLTAMGRMEDRKHFASDVVAGATIGWIVGRSIATREERIDESTFQLVPQGNGFAIVRRF